VRRGSTLKQNTMPIPEFLQDLIRLLLNLAPVSALGCLVFAGISLRREGGTNFYIGSGFSKWMFWAVVFVTLPQLLSFFASRGVNVPVPSGVAVSTDWLRSIESGVVYFTNNLVISRLVPTLAAFFVLRAVLDSAEGTNPLKSILTAMFLLAVSTTFSLIWTFNSGSDLALADVLDSLWNYLAGRIMPLAAGLAVIGAIFSFATARPWLRLVACSLGFLTVSALWRLVVAMM
jgi:hypothetical protein